MNIPISVSTQFSYECPKHNSPIILSDPDLNKGGMCLVCLQNLTGMVTIDQLQQNITNFINKINQENNHYIQYFKLIWDKILQLKMEIIFSLDKILKVLIDQIEIIETNQQQLGKMLSSNDQLALGKVQSQFEVQKNNYEEIINQVKIQLKEFQQKFFNIDQLLYSLNIPTQQTQFETLNLTLENQKIENVLINESKIIESKECLAFEFNEGNNILLVACEKEILVYQFKNGLITKLMQRLTEHTGIVHCLYFMKKSNSFVSGGQDKSIIIWNIKNNKYLSQSILKDHQSNVICVLMNKKEDLLISGSYDFTVKFWNKCNIQWNCKQTIFVYNLVEAISLNEQENKLILCGNWSSIIQILEIKNDQWNIFQTIKIFEIGYRLSFTIGNQFIFQPKTQNYLEVFDYDINKGQFQKISQIQVQNCSACWDLFPCQIIRQLNIIILKHGNQVNIFEINKQGKYRQIGFILFETDDLYGRLTSDGQYLVTWDGISKEIQVRKLNYQQ